MSQIPKEGWAAGEDEPPKYQRTICDEEEDDNEGDSDDDGTTKSKLLSDNKGKGYRSFIDASKYESKNVRVDSRVRRLSSSRGEKGGRRRKKGKHKNVFEQARLEYSAAISSDDVTKFEAISQRYKEVLTMESRELCCIEDDSGCGKKTLLQEALETDRRCVVDYIVSKCTITYLLDDYPEIAKKESKRRMIASLSSKKRTYLHLMVEHGNNDAMDKVVCRLKEACISFDDENTSNSWPKLPSTFGFAKTQKDLDDFLNAKVSFETKDRRKRQGSSVHLAVMSGNWHMLESLKSYGLSMDEKDTEQETALMLSIQIDQSKALKELIKLGADLDIQNSKDTAALHMAISEQKDKMAKLLIEEDTIDLNIERIKNPRWPVEIASKVNNARVVGWLLDRNNSHGPIYNTNVHQALLIAASNGFAEVISVILERKSKLLNKPDDFENTPLMLAADSGKLEAVKLLVEMPEIDLDKRNNLGQSVFDMAMKLEDESVLIFLLGRVKFNDALDSFYVHTAVANGKVNRLKLLLSDDHQHEKLQLLEDNTENSVYHTAAAFNSSEVIDLFLDENDDIKDLQNKNCETALHVAVRRNNVEAVNSLLNKRVRVDVQDSEGQNILHAAVTTRATGMEIFDMLLEAFDKVDPSLVNEQESNGNTILHLSAMLSKPEMIRKLNMCDPEIENKDGETALHLGARLGSAETVRTLLELFYTERKANIDRRDELGFSALYRSAEEGDREKYELMLSYGADMGLTSENGPSILHRLVECCKADPNKSDKYANVYRATVQWAVVWHCRKKGLRCPLANTNQYYLVQLDAVKLLTNETLYENCNVLQYASKKGEGKMLKTILDTPNVYRFDKNSQLKLEKASESSGNNIKNSAISILSDMKVEASKLPLEPNNGELAKFLEEKSSLPANTIIYDVTYLVPGHFPDHSEKRNCKVDTSENQNFDRRKSQVAIRSNTSCLEYVVDSGHESDINEILSEEPFHTLVYTYWTLCRRGYELLMWTHVMYMVLLTYFLIPEAAWIENRFHDPPVIHQNSTSSGENDVIVRNWFSIRMYSFFLIWPIIIFLYEMIIACHFVINIRNNNENNSLRYALLGKLKVGEITSGLMRVPVGLMLFVFDNLSHISSVSFTVSCLVWYVSCVYSTRLQTYLNCLAIFMISGWLHTINYVKGFKDWNALANILKTILIKDLTRFIYIYIFVLISFGYAIHVLIQINTTAKPELTSSTSTIYLTFYQMLSPGNVLDITESPLYLEGGRHKGASMLRAVYATYSILSSVVLMNMLIAMMNSTYSDVKSVRVTAWRFESLRMAVWIERNFMLVGRLKLIKFKAKYDKWQNRWFMKNIPDKIKEPKNTPEVDAILGNLEAGKAPEKSNKNSSKQGGDLTKKLEEMRGEIDKMNEALAWHENKSARVFNGLNMELKTIHELCLVSYHLARVNSGKVKKG